MVPRTRIVTTHFTRTIVGPVEGVHTVTNECRACDYQFESSWPAGDFFANARVADNDAVKMAGHIMRNHPALDAKPIRALSLTEDEV